MRARHAVVALFAAIPFVPPVASEEGSNGAASTRSAFEAQFPAMDATAAALELEALAAAAGIDIAPPGEARAHPSAEWAETCRTGIAAAAAYLHANLGGTAEPLPPLLPELARYLSDRRAEIDAIRARLLQPEQIAWELDVSRGLDGARLNRLGLIRLYRVLVARALSESREGQAAEALETLEAGWRLFESLAARPEFITHLVLVGFMQLDVAALRRIDDPAYSWTDRLRDTRSLDDRLLSAFQNDFWLVSGATDLTEKTAAWGRIQRRLIETIREDNPCDWTESGLNDAVREAATIEAPEDQTLAGIGIPNLLNALLRWRRLRLDGELTALILEARAERIASRRGIWPAKLSNLESSVCPGARWSYRGERDGTALLALESKPPADPESGGLTLPLFFRAGIPLTPTPRRLTPRVTGRTLPRS